MSRRTARGTPDSESARRLVEPARRQKQGVVPVRPPRRHMTAAVLGGLAAVLILAAAVSSEAADAQAGRRKAEACAACHGEDGNSTIPGMPSLAGQPAFYTHWQLIKFRDGRRRDPQMTPFAINLTDADMADLALYYQGQTSRPRPAVPDLARAARGRQLAETHHCTSCHRPGLVGQQQVPRLAGQDYDYLLRLLRGFKARTASDLDGTMTIAAQPLGDEDIVDLVHFMVSIGRSP